MGNSLGPKAPEIQQMYSLNIPVSEIRTKVRQEFERHRYVNQLSVVDMLLFQSHSEFQVRTQPATQSRPHCRLLSLSASKKLLAKADIHIATGNTELLEAADARTQILQRKGESCGKVAAKLYGGLSTGVYTAAMFESRQGGN